MPADALKKLLEREGVQYESIRHRTTYTAQRTAESVHIPGNELAKTVMVKVDGRLVMIVLPASALVDLAAVRELAGGARADLATEAEFRDAFPGCEVGAMPPFGNLYGMDVFVDEELAKDERIAFNAGTHDELIRLAYSDFARLVRPKVHALSPS